MKCHLKFTLFIIASILINYKSFSQIGGTGTYRFLDLANSARVAALGGTNISLNDSDLNMTYHNPSLLNKANDGQIAVNGSSLFVGGGFGYASYAKHVDSVGTFAAGLFYTDYGTFKGADRTGAFTNYFYAHDYVINLMYSRSIDTGFQVGVNIKPLLSYYERYSSFGLVADLGAVYTSKDGLFSAGLTFRNFGYQITTFTSGNREPIAYDILLGVSQKLAHAPFRISITAHNLQKFKMNTELPDENKNAFDQTTTQPSKLEDFADNFFRHMLFGLEFIPSKSFYLAVAYNYQRRMEMSLEEAPGTVGFSYGAGIRLKRFSISYGRLVYHAAGASNHFSVLVNLPK